jgi:hypothetical protein
MSKGPVTSLPLLVKIAVALTCFNSRVLFEETVVDRHGLWRYMPFYRVGVFCTWDAVALLIIGLGVWYAFRRWRRSPHLLQTNRLVLLN